MTVTYYRDTDGSAPQLRGQVGTVIAILDACLVNGYGSKSSSGWTKVYSGTNKAVYRAPAGSRMYLRIDDTGAQSIRIRSYESMSDVDTGTAPCPTDAQLSGGAYAYKSGAASSATRPWMVLADDKRVWFISSYNSTTFAADTAVHGQGFFFGDLISYKAGDAYHCMVIAGESGASNASRAGEATGSRSSSNTTHYIQRAYTQTGTSITAGKHQNAVIGSTTGIGNAGLTYPESVTGGIVLSPIWVHENVNQVVRGRLPGVMSPCHALFGTAGDTFAGAGELTGKDFILLNMGNGGSGVCRGAFEISDTWE